MNTTTAPARLTWRRKEGAYVASSSHHEYAAAIARSSHVTFDGAPGWRLIQTTFGRFLDSGHFRTLAEAKAYADTTIHHLP